MRLTLPILWFILCISGSGYSFSIDIPIHYEKLANGLRIIIVPDTNVAVVSCRLYYFAGSMYEGPGTSGLSHIYEHMMFKGTKILGTSNLEEEKKYMRAIDSLDLLIASLREQNIPERDTLIGEYRKQIVELLNEQRKYIKKDEIWQLYENNGGTHLNAWTGDDLTAYIVTLPKNKVELFCWIETDRMRNLVLREFYSERDVVAEERRMRYENRPVNNYWEKLTAHFYLAHPYRIPTIGWMSDIQRQTRESLKKHIEQFYTPNNGLLILVGNVKVKETLRLIKRYFGLIPSSKKPKKKIITREPRATGETRFTVYDNVQPRIDMLFQIPGYPHDDLIILDVVESIFSGRSGRLYKRLVTQDKLCINAGGGCAYKLHNGYFHIWAIPKTGVDSKDIEDAILDEINKVIAHPPSKREMERIKNSMQMHFVSRLKSLEGLSDQLAWYESLGSWKDLLDYPKKLAAVTADQVPAVAKRYFVSELKTIGLLLRKKENTDATRENDY